MVRRVENNRRRNERNRLRRDEINNRQNARYERMHCIARNNTIPDYKYLGEMNYICQHCGAKKFPDETHFLCCHNGKVVLWGHQTLYIDLTLFHIVVGQQSLYLCRY